MRGEWQEFFVEPCEELGMAMAAGLVLDYLEGDDGKLSAAVLDPYGVDCDAPLNSRSRPCSFADGDKLHSPSLRPQRTPRLRSADLGVKRSIAYWYDVHSKAFLLTMIAVQKLGAIFVPEHRAKGVFLEHQVRNIELRVIVSGDELRGALDTISTDGLILRQQCCRRHMSRSHKGALFWIYWLVRHDLRYRHTVRIRYRDDYVYFRHHRPSKGVMMPHAHCSLGSDRAVRFR